MSDDAEYSQRISRRGYLAGAAAVASGAWFVSGFDLSDPAPDPAGSPFVPENIEDISWITAHGFRPLETAVAPGESVSLTMTLHNQGGEPGTFDREAVLQYFTEDDVLKYVAGSQVTADVPAGEVVEETVEFTMPETRRTYQAVIDDVWHSFDLMGQVRADIEVTA